MFRREYTKILFSHLSLVFLKWFIDLTLMRSNTVQNLLEVGPKYS